jgi:hypothetical protein
MSDFNLKGTKNVDGRTRNQGGKRELTPKASFIPAQGNALGLFVRRIFGALKARLIRQRCRTNEAGLWPALHRLNSNESRALPWAGMNQAFGLPSSRGES